MSDSDVELLKSTFMAVSIAEATGMGTGEWERDPASAVTSGMGIGNFAQWQPLQKCLSTPTFAATTSLPVADSASLVFPSAISPIGGDL